MITPYLIAPAPDDPNEMSPLHIRHSVTEWEQTHLCCALISAAHAPDPLSAARAGQGLKADVRQSADPSEKRSETGRRIELPLALTGPRSSRCQVEIGIHQDVSGVGPNFTDKGGEPDLLA